jgi:ribosomal protein S18 acetylase RimI-like enzyme
MEHSKTIIRPVEKRDREPILRMVEHTKMFSPPEVEVAMELVDACLHKEQRDYITFVTDDGTGLATGYVCFGPTPATEGTFDLYWIVVSPDQHNRGLGKKLLRFTEEEIIKKGGRLIIIETSSQMKYHPTREFYLRNGYRVEAVIKDFYSRGDDRIIFTKMLNNPKEEM